MQTQHGPCGSLVREPPAREPTFPNTTCCPTGHPTANMGRSDPTAIIIQRFLAETEGGSSEEIPALSHYALLRLHAAYSLHTDAGKSRHPVQRGRALHGP